MLHKRESWTLSPCAMIKWELEAAIYLKVTHSVRFVHTHESQISLSLWIKAVPHTSYMNMHRQTITGRNENSKNSSILCIIRERDILPTREVNFIFVMLFHQEDPSNSRVNNFQNCQPFALWSFIPTSVKKHIDLHRVTLYNNKILLKLGQSEIFAFPCGYSQLWLKRVVFHITEFRFSIDLI